MAKPTSRLSVVREWCQSLGVLTAVSISHNEADMKLAAFVPSLAREFPEGAFTPDSLRHVARASVRGFPTYPELCIVLADWWRVNGPPAPALPGPDMSFRRQVEAREAQCRAEWDDPASIRASLARAGSDPVLLNMLAGAVKRYAPQHLGELPPDVIERFEQRAPEVTRRAPESADAP
jgi:hypothetical protein